APAPHPLADRLRQRLGGTGREFLWLAGWSRSSLSPIILPLSGFGQNRLKLGHTTGDARFDRPDGHSQDLSNALIGILLQIKKRYRGVEHRVHFAQQRQYRA